MTKYQGGCKGILVKGRGGSAGGGSGEADGRDNSNDVITSLGNGRVFLL